MGNSDSETKWSKHQSNDLKVLIDSATSNTLESSSRDGVIGTYNDLSFEGAAAVAAVDVVLTLAFEYSDTRFSKKFVFP